MLHISLVAHKALLLPVCTVPQQPHEIFPLIFKGLTSLHTSSFIKHISLLAPKDLLLHSLSLMSSIVSDNCNLEYFSDFCKGFQNLKRHWIPWLNIFSCPIFWEGSGYLYHAKDIYRVLASYLCVHQLTHCEWNEPKFGWFYPSRRVMRWSNCQIAEV